MICMARPILYSVWSDMKRRCLNPNRPEYKNYGGRGISTCQEWLNYNNFEKDMISTYKKGLTLDRINNDGNYCKENCHWITRKEQSLNTRTNRIIEYNGIKKTLSQWIELLKLKSSTIKQRFYVYKWNVDKCFNYKGGKSYR